MIGIFAPVGYIFVWKIDYLVLSRSLKILLRKNNNPCLKVFYLFLKIKFWDKNSILCIKEGFFFFFKQNTSFSFICICIIVIEVNLEFSFYFSDIALKQIVQNIVPMFSHYSTIIRFIEGN